jgi:hypothetical protein
MFPEIFFIVLESEESMPSATMFTASSISVLLITLGVVDLLRTLGLRF